MSVITAQQAPAPTRPVCRQAERITGRTYLSHSQLSCMRSCPRKFSFQYVEKARQEFIPSSLIFGGAIHAALELFFRAALEGLGVTPEAMFSAYLDAWRRQREQHPEIPIRLNKAETEPSLQSLAQRMIQSFLASPLAIPNGQILGVEEELRIQLDPDLPDLLARVDLITQTASSLHVIDFKTSRSKWTPVRAEESSEQLQLYGITLGRLSRYLGLAIHLHYGVITKAKTPVVQLLEVAGSPERASAVKDSVHQIWQAIQVGNFYPNPSPQNCTTCPYHGLCPVFGGKRL
jgi:putative RecB family exonuclease